MRQYLKYILLMVALLPLLVCCNHRGGKQLSNEELFIQNYSDSAMLFDRDCLLSDVIREDIDLSEDNPTKAVSVIDNDVRIEVDGTFKGEIASQPGQYRYHMIYHYMILDEKYCHFCPDTITIYSLEGEELEVHPPYEHAMIEMEEWEEEDFELE